MKITTFLTFVGNQCGKAKEAIRFYTSIFPNSEIKSIVNYKKGEDGGTPELIKYGVFALNGTEYMVSESNYNHHWSFTPGVSIFVSDNSEDFIRILFEKLSLFIPRYQDANIPRYCYGTVYLPLIYSVIH